MFYAAFGSLNHFFHFSGEKWGKASKAGRANISDPGSVCYPRSSNGASASRHRRENRREFHLGLRPKFLRFWASHKFCERVCVSRRASGSTNSRKAEKTHLLARNAVWRPLRHASASFHLEKVIRSRLTLKNMFAPTLPPEALKLQPKAMATWQGSIKKFSVLLFGSNNHQFDFWFLHAF